MNLIAQLGLCLALLLPATSAIADEPLSEEQRKELVELPKKFRAAKTTQDKLQLLERAKELGEKGVERMRPLVTGPVKKLSTTYAGQLQAALVKAAQTKNEPLTLSAALEALPPAKSTREQLLAAIQLADTLAPPAFGEKMTQFETELVEKMEALRRMQSLDRDEQQLVELINKVRVQRGLNPLQVDPALCKAAKTHSNDMQREGFFSHTSPLPGKQSFSDRARLFGVSASAENIAKTGGGQATYTAWMKSDGHRANILSKSRRIGVGRAGKFYTAVFGR